MDRASCQGAIEGTENFLIDPPSYREVSRSFKIVFQEEKNTDTNVIKDATQSRIQNTF